MQAQDNLRFTDRIECFAPLPRTRVEVPILVPEFLGMEDGRHRVVVDRAEQQLSMMDLMKMGMEGRADIWAENKGEVGRGVGEDMGEDVEEDAGVDVEMDEEYNPLLLHFSNSSDPPNLTKETEVSEEEPPILTVETKVSEKEVG